MMQTIYANVASPARIGDFVRPPRSRAPRVVAEIDEVGGRIAVRVAGTRLQWHDVASTRLYRRVDTDGVAERDPVCVCGHRLSIHDRMTSSANPRGPMCYTDNGCPDRCFEFLARNY